MTELETYVRALDTIRDRYPAEPSSTDWERMLAEMRAVPNAAGGYIERFYTERDFGDRA